MRIELTEPLAAVPVGFTIQAPPRIAIDLPGVGTVEAFNTDGLRTLATTLKVPHMRERTLRWPGHIELMNAFRAAGCFQKEPIEVRGADGEMVRVSPLAVMW